MLIDPFPAQNELVPEITDMSDRSAETGQAKLEKGPEHFRRRTAMGGDGDIIRGNVHVSRVVEQRHEPEVHVQLLMAVEERPTGIVCDEIEFDLLKAA